LFAALEIAAGQVTAVCKNRHRHQEFLAFLKHLARADPNRQLHLVMDNYAAHKAQRGPDVAHREPRTHASSCTSPNRRATFTPVHDLMIKIRAFTGWNDPSTRSSGPRPPTRFSTRSTAKVDMS
jgi:hypothetical protein